MNKPLSDWTDADIVADNRRIDIAARHVRREMSAMPDAALMEAINFANGVRFDVLYAEARKRKLISPTP